MAEREPGERHFYDRQYFDPVPGVEPKSNFRQYVDGRRYYLPLAVALSLEFLREKSDKELPFTVVDIGCAKEYLVKAFNTTPFLKAYGVDFSDYATVASPASIHGRIIQGDARVLPLPDNFADLVVSFDTLEHLDEPGVDLTI